MAPEKYNRTPPLRHYQIQKVVRLLLKILPYLSHFTTPYWISHSWKFMRDKNLTLEEGTTHLLPQRQNDSFITEDFIISGFEGDIVE